MKQPEKLYFDDFEHRVSNKIRYCGDKVGFPKLADYGIERQDLDGYLFDKQAILDMGGSKQSQLTVGGIITVLPVLVLSAFPDGSPVYALGKMWATVLALLLGLLVALFVKALLQMVVYYRLGKLKDPKIEAYIKAVLAF